MLPDGKNPAIDTNLAAQNLRHSPPRRRRGGWLALGAIAVVVYCVIALLNPWALHIGGQWTPFMYWTGTGKLVTSDGTYPLLVRLYPSPHGSQLRLDGLRPISGLHGQAWLCTPKGGQFLDLTGTIYGRWRSTDGALIRFRLLERYTTRERLLGEVPRRGYIDLYGYWHGPELAMNDRSSWSPPFRQGFALKNASVTLKSGSKTDYNAACAANRVSR